MDAAIRGKPERPSFAIQSKLTLHENPGQQYHHLCLTACLCLSPPLADDPDSHVSEITRMEVLGYYLLDAQAKAWFETAFSQLRLLPADKPVTDKAIELRRQRKMLVGDAIIAATALLNKAEECEGFLPAFLP